MAQVPYKSSDRALEAEVKRTTRELLVIYAALYIALRDVLADAYERYAFGGILAWDVMQRYNRMAKMEMAIREEMRKMGGRSAQTTERKLREIYEEMYRATGDSLTRATGVALGVIVARGLLDAAVSRPTTGMSITQRILMHRDDLTWKVRQIVTRGMLRGENYPELMREVKKQLSMDAVRAARWVRTEAHRLQNEARWAAGQEAIAKGVILRKMWVTMADDKVRDSHAEMDGQTVAADAYFTSPSGAKALHPGGFGVLEEDANCRCVMVWITGE